MDLKNMITKRASVRKYTDRPVSEEIRSEILDFFRQATPLYPDIQVEAKIVDREQVRFYMPWKTPQLMAFFSENKPGYLENAGFLLQQVDLYLQSRGLGSCWLGMGKFRKSEVPQMEGMEFVIFIAFGHPEGEYLRENLTQFKRKPMTEITDREDPRLEPARLAPSATNSQPWYFTHEGETIHAFCSEAGLLRHAMLGNMNRIDMGIALSHLYITNPQTFRFEHCPPATTPKGYRYTGTVTL